jgi:hypothetical protein
MSDFLEQVVMGPITEQYCQLFLMIALIAFFWICLSVFMLAYQLVVHGSKVSGTLLLMWFSNMVVYFIVYLENRILYNMCKRVY